MEQGPPTPWKPVQLLIIPCLLAGIQNVVHTRSARDSMATWLRRDPDEQFSLSSGFCRGSVSGPNPEEVEKQAGGGGGCMVPPPLWAHALELASCFASQQIPLPV